MLPPLLTGFMLLADRFVRRLARSSLPTAVSPRHLLLLAVVSIVSHPILDTLNTYGVRWLMPFDGRWFYGDAVFIVDPWLWLTLGLGLLLGRRRRSDGHGAESRRPARIALAVSAAYALGMTGSGVAARRIVTAELERGGTPVEQLLLSPSFATPFRRTMVAAQGDQYLVGRFQWLPAPGLEPGSLRRYPRGRPEHPAVDAAAASRLGRRFLGWARFPLWRVEPGGRESYVVRILDLRYAERSGARFGEVAIPVTVGAAP